MNELLKAARAAKEYLRTQCPMTGDVTALVVKLQVGIEEAEREQLSIREYLENKMPLNELALRVSGHI